MSTDKQASEGVCLEVQRARIESWCTANGYDLAHVFVDEGISGRRMDTRPKLLVTFSALKPDMVLVTYSLSRLARSNQDAQCFCKAVAKKKADLVSLTEHIDTTTATGKMMFQMLTVMAEFESNLVAERTRNALQHKEHTGQKYTNQAPYGFEAVDGRPVPVQQERFQRRCRTASQVGLRVGVVRESRLPGPAAQSCKPLPIA